MKIKEFHQKSDLASAKTRKELKDLLVERRERIGQIRFDLASKKLKNIREIKEVKKDIARILTLLNQKL